MMLMYFVTLVVILISIFVYKKYKQFKNLPPGPWGLPILGYLPFLDSKKPHITLTELSKKYGPIYSIQMGSVFTVVLADHKLIREAFAKESFSGRAPLYLTHGIMLGNGIICAEGALWRDQRKLVTTWLRSYGMTKHSVNRKVLESRLARGADQFLEEISLAKATGHKELALPALAADALGAVVHGLVFGFAFQRNDPTYRWLRQIQEEGCEEMGIAGVVNFLPFYRFISKSTREIMNRLIRGQSQTHRLYRSIIARRRKILGLSPPKNAPMEEVGSVKCIRYGKLNNESEFHYFDPENLEFIDGDCILDGFLMEQKKRMDENDDSAEFMTDNQLWFLLADMFGAGLDTTHVTLSWFLLYMAIYEDEQELVRQEVLKYYQTSPEDGADASSLPLLSAALAETQRIRSIVPLGIPHGTTQDTSLSGYEIPRGTMVVPLQWAVHMDETVWEDPDVFRPSRFLDDEGKLLKPQEFIPFQTGKRMCPGDELGRMASLEFAARLLRAHRFRLSAPTPDISGHVGVTLTPPKVMFYCDPVSSA